MPRPEAAPFPAHPSLWTNAWPGQEARTVHSWSFVQGRMTREEHSYKFFLRKGKTPQWSINRSRGQSIAEVNIGVNRKHWGKALVGSDTPWTPGPDRERLRLLALGIVSAWNLSLRHCCCPRGYEVPAPGFFVSLKPIKPVGISGSP